MVTLDILRDTRERLPWSFEPFDVTTDDVTIETGDYTLPEFCDFDEELETYYPQYAIERKSGDDFMESITHEMKRFQQEIRRACRWEDPLLVIVEEPKSPSRYQDDFIDFYDVGREQVFSTVDTLEREYNVRFRFARNRNQAQRVAYDSLFSRLRSRLVS